MKLLFLFLSFGFYAEYSNLDEGSNSLWKMFVAAALDEDLREDFHDKLEAHHSNTPESTAYFGAAKMLMAEVVFNPYSKYSYFNDGAKLLDSAIMKKPKDAELRYLRLMIQAKAPRMLNYREQLEADYTFIKSTIKESDEKQEWMISFEKFVEENRKEFPSHLITTP